MNQTVPYKGYIIGMTRLFNHAIGSMMAHHILDILIPFLLFCNIFNLVDIFSYLSTIRWKPIDERTR